MKRSEFVAIAEVETEADFVESVRTGKAKHRLPAPDVEILATNLIHGWKVLYVYDDDGVLIGQQWILNVERPDRRSG